MRSTSRGSYRRRRREPDGSPLVQARPCGPRLLGGLEPALADLLEQRLVGDAEQRAACLRFQWVWWSTRSIVSRSASSAARRPTSRSGSRARALLELRRSARAAPRCGRGRARRGAARRGSAPRSRAPRRASSGSRARARCPGTGSARAPRRRRRRERADRLLVAGREAPQEALDQHRDLLAPLAQRRDASR